MPPVHRSTGDTLALSFLSLRRDWISNCLSSFLTPQTERVPSGVFGFPGRPAVSSSLVLGQISTRPCFISHVTYLLSPRDPVSMRTSTPIPFSLFPEPFSYFRTLYSFLGLRASLPKLPHPVSAAPVSTPLSVAIIVILMERGTYIIP